MPRIGWARIERHPMRFLDPVCLEVVRLWQLWRPTGLGGCGPLPFAGGSADQPVVLLDAFAHCSRVAHDIRAEEDAAREKVGGRN